MSIILGLERKEDIVSADINGKTFCVRMWSPQCRRDVDLMEPIQGRATRMKTLRGGGGQIQTAFQRCVRHGCVTDRVRLVPSLSSWKGLLERKAGKVPCVVFRCGSLLPFGSEGSCPLLMASV